MRRTHEPNADDQKTSAPRILTHSQVRYNCNTLQPNADDQKTSTLTTSQRQQLCAPHMNESCPTYEGVMSHEPTADDQKTSTPRTSQRQQLRVPLAQRPSSTCATNPPQVKPKAAARPFSCTLLYTATLCNTLQYTATHCNTLQHTAMHCNTLQYTATHCNTLQHTATHTSHSSTRATNPTQVPLSRFPRPSSSRSPSFPLSHSLALFLLQLHTHKPKQPHRQGFAPPSISVALTLAQLQVEGGGGGG